MTKGIVYLAIAYSHKNPRIREIRYEIANIISAYLMNLGVVIFSPITHSHPLAAYNLPTGWDYWKSQDLSYLTVCESIIAVTLDGWKESIGLQDEVNIMKDMGKKVSFFDPCDLVDAKLARLLKEHAALLNTPVAENNRKGI